MGRAPQRLSTCSSSSSSGSRWMFRLVLTGGGCIEDNSRARGGRRPARRSARVVSKAISAPRLCPKKANSRRPKSTCSTRSVTRSPMRLYGASSCRGARPGSLTAQTRTPGRPLPQRTNSPAEPPAWAKQYRSSAVSVLGLRPESQRSRSSAVMAAAATWSAPVGSPVPFIRSPPRWPGRCRSAAARSGRPGRPRWRTRRATAS